MSALDDYREAREGSFYKVTALTITMKADAAIADLEALVAKYKWQVGEAWEMVPPQDELPSFPDRLVDWFSELDRRWEELS